MFAPMAKLEDESELGQRDGKQDICSNRKKRQASWIGAKESKRGTLPQAGEKRSKLDWSKRVEKRNVAPSRKKEKQAGLEHKTAE